MINLALVIRKWRVMSEYSHREAAEIIGMQTRELIRLEAGLPIKSGALAQLLHWLVATEQVAKNGPTNV